jgi:uncharacterized membrane protein YkvA (DUF1232 family)
MDQRLVTPSTLSSYQHDVAAIPLVEMAPPLVTEDDADKQTNWFQGQLSKGRQAIAFGLAQAWTLTLVVKHPRAPWLARIVAAGTVAYLLSPIQLIPTFIPVIGQLDDVFVLFVGMKLLRKLIPPEILAACEAQAGSLSLVQRIVGESSSPSTDRQSAVQD